MSLTYNNMGVLYSRSGSHERALEYLMRTLEVEVAGNFGKAQVATTCLNVTTVLSSKQGDHSRGGKA